jgi:type I restriction enzyme S subunit
MSVPALRFKDDDGQEFPEWEEKTLGATLSIFSGYAFSSADSQDDGVKWLKIADVGIQQMTPNNISYLPIELKDKHSNFLVYKNDYVIALTRPILNGKLKIAKVDEFYDESLLNQRVGKLITAHDIDFIYFLLQHKNTISHIADTISGTDPPILSLNAIKDICLIIPTNKIEQTKIANFLTAVDDKISLLTQKADLLSQYKKGLMQQIFSQELRFKDDDGQEFPEWEEKTLGDVTKKISDNRNKELTDAKVYSVTNNNGFVLQSEHFDRVIAGSDLTNYKIIQKHEFAYNPSRINVGSIALFENDIGIISSLYVCFSTTDKLLDRFLLNVLELEYTKFQIENLGEGGVRVYLWYDLFSLIKFKLPSLPEQTKIANFLTAIDEKITNNQTQLDAVKQYKQGLLQQMFV